MPRGHIYAWSVELNVSYHKVNHYILFMGGDLNVFPDISSMPTHISVRGYMYPLVFPFGGTCSFLRVHIF